MISLSLLRGFLEADPDARLWAGEPDDFADAPDCDIMATRFANWLADRGVIGRVVCVETSSPSEPLLGTHYFTVVNGIAVDWTARQFHNARGVDTDWSQIPCPLLFVWPGTYPLPIDLQEIHA